MIDNKKCILIADDEKEIRDILTLLLNAEGYHVIAAEDGQEAVDKASDDIDLFILDVNMPRLTGIMAAVELRKTYQTPIIFLTAYSGESDKVMGFSAGADDYIVKPFSNVELLLRVKAILRRTGAFCMPEASKEQADSLQKNKIEIQDIILDLDSQSVIKGEKNIALTYTEFKILKLLAAHKKKIYSLESIYSSIWDDEAVGDAAIMVHIKNIRKKLEDNSRNPIYIKTAWGRGYYID